MEDIRVDWQEFIDEPETSKNVVDVIFSYGDKFPILDQDGNEVIPTEGCLCYISILYFQVQVYYCCTIDSGIK